MREKKKMKESEREGENSWKGGKCVTLKKEEKS